MKPIVQITLFYVMLMLASLGRVFGQYQDCITFHSDYSGLEWDAAERTRIITAACDLKTLIADAGVSGFKVHTFGFYGYNPNMQGGTEAVWNDFLASKVNTATPHLAIGKEINLDGSFKKFWISFHVPAQSLLSCITNADKNSIISILSSLNGSGQAGFPSPQNIISKAKSLTSIIICKCGAENGNRSGCATPDLNYIEDKLTMLGYANYNHLDNITFESKTYAGGLSASKKITLTINSSVASPESFPSGKFELTDELNEFLGEVGGAAVVHYIDNDNIYQFDDILNGGPSFARGGHRSGASYQERIFLINLNGLVKVYYTIDAELPAENGARAGGIGAIGQKFIKWFCKRAGTTPLTTVAGVIVDYAAESAIEYFFNNDDGKYTSYSHAFYEVAYKRGVVGLVISVAVNVFDSPLVNAVGTFLNHFVSRPYSQWDPLVAFATAAAGTLFQATGAAIAKIPSVAKFIGNIVDDCASNPNFFLKFIALYPHQLKAWKQLKELTPDVAWARQNVALLTKLSGVDQATVTKVANFYKTFQCPSKFLPPGTYNGIKYNAWGFPDFSEFYPALINGKNFKYKPQEGLSTTSSGGSFTKATNWLKENYPNVSGSGGNFKINGVEYTWHHLEDGETLVPVIKSLHKLWHHTGGWSVIQKEIIGFFK